MIINGSRLAFSTIDRTNQSISFILKRVHMVSFLVIASFLSTVIIVIIYRLYQSFTYSDEVPRTNVLTATTKCDSGEENQLLDEDEDE